MTTSKEVSDLITEEQRLLEELHQAINDLTKLDPEVRFAVLKDLQFFIMY